MTKCNSEKYNFFLHEKKIHLTQKYLVHVRQRPLFRNIRQRLGHLSSYSTCVAGPSPAAPLEQASQVACVWAPTIKTLSITGERRRRRRRRKEKKYNHHSSRSSSSRAFFPSACSRSQTEKRVFIVSVLLFRGLTVVHFSSGAKTGKAIGDLFSKFITSFIHYSNLCNMLMSASPRGSSGEPSC